MSGNVLLVYVCIDLLANLYAVRGLVDARLNRRRQGKLGKA